MTEVYLYTQGCKVNQYETEAMREILQDAGYSVRVFTPGMEDIGDAYILINSCTVTGESDRKLRQFLRRCRREHPKASLILTGCYPQAYADESETLELADIVMGNARRLDLLPLLRTFEETGERICSIPPHDKSFEPLCIRDFDERTRAFVKIQDGCNCFCTYCIIPFARGRIRSKDPETLKAELQALAQTGYTEIVLTGINLTAYGKEYDLDLADAVLLAEEIPGIARIRLGSLEPDDMTLSLIQKLTASKKLCPQFHLALQSGCTSTLQRMRRRYTAEEFSAVSASLREAFPDCTLTTDVMVGFPGETEEEFEASLAFVKKIGFSKLHVFPYSKRPGTKAADFPGQISTEEKNRRCRLMIEAGKESQEAILSRLIGKTTEILTETRLTNHYTEGYTTRYDPVHVEGIFPPNHLLRVKIEAVRDGICLAKPLL